MSILTNFLDWFGQQHIAVQFFVAAFIVSAMVAIGIPTFGGAPLALVLLLAAEHYLA